MLWRILAIVVGVGFAAYRFMMWFEIRKARRAGDTARERRLRQHGFGLHRWAALGLLVFTLVLTAIVWSNSR